MNQGSSGGGEGFEVTKFGHGRVALIGFPRSVPLSLECSSLNFLNEKLRTIPQLFHLEKLGEAQSCSKIFCFYLTLR